MISELADSNPGNARITGTGTFSGDTHLLGNFALQRYWRRYQTLLDYSGGGVLYSGPHQVPNSQVHSLNFDQAIMWRTGLMQIRNNFSYLPEGFFGGGFGGSLGMASVPGGGSGTGLGGFGGGGGTNFFGTGQFGALGVAPRITDRAIIDVQNSLTPRTSITLAGGYGLAHFTHANSGLIDSRQISAQAGYNYALNRRNSIALVYGFQRFTFPQGGGGNFNSNVIHFMYGHQISGRMDLKIGAGPQIVQIHSSTGVPATPFSANRISASGMASLRYRFPKTALALMYERVENPGSGFFAGATSDLAHVSANRPLSRRWEVMINTGYSHNHRTQLSTLGLNANSYNYGFAGARLARTFTRTLNGFVTYQFNALRSGGRCVSSTTCDLASDRHLMGIGITWRPQPIRID
jgi:hypothetical protein